MTSNVSNVSSVMVCASSFVYTCYILCRLTYFLSKHEDAKLGAISDDNIGESTLWSILIDVSCLAIFVFQHSIMTNNFTKHLLQYRLNVEHLDRSIYNACSSASLHFLINQWQQTRSAVLWKIETSNDVIWMLFSSLHVFAWSIIYSGCIMMDIAELSGVKQAWHAMYGRISPLNVKSKELRRYMTHMRHPSFTGFLIILWIHPCMTMDRLLMAIILTVYMALMWTIDSNDYNYHMRYFKQKQMELS